MLLDDWKENVKHVGPIVPPVQRMERAYLTTLSAGLATFAVVYVVNAYLAHIGLPSAATFLDDFILSFLVALFVLSLEMHHRKELISQAEKIAMMQQIATLQQMNHHVRNALQVIGYVALHTTDHDMASKLTQAVQRIELALRGGLPEEEHQVRKD
ncbi:MAG TPA: hypothetical protein VKG65_00700 [Terriglobales bacterium]|nr:hypothetical protein [Terriglobales bacterium]